MPLALFAPDKFSAVDPVFTPVPAALAHKLRGIARRHWPDAAAGAVEAVGDVVTAGMEANSHNFRLSGPEGEFVLKRVTRPDLLPVISVQMALMRHCAELGADIPRPCASAAGTMVVEDDGQFWCLLEFAEGRYFQGAPDEIALAGAAIGRLHHLLGDVPPALMPDRARPPYFTEEERAGLDALIGCRPRWSGIFGSETARVLDENWPVIETNWDRLSANSRLSGHPPAPVHFDLHPHNLLIRGRQCRILDFDSVILAPAPMALGFAMVKLIKRVEAARRRTGADAPSPPEAARRFLDAVVGEWPAAPDQRDLELYARAEVMRRFLSVCRFILAGREMVWNGPLVHMAALVEADSIFRRDPP